MKSLFTLILISILSIWSLNAQSKLMAMDYRIPKETKAKLISLKEKLKKPKLTSIYTEATLDEETTAEVSLTEFDITVNNVITEAETYLGTKYRYGGTTRSGIDCSAFMQKIFKVEGVELPRVSYHQAKTGQAVSRGELQKGDLIFFSTTSRYRITHVGMVTEVTEDDITFIHAASSKGVSYASLNHPYWNSRYRGARRPDKFAEFNNETIVSKEKEVITSTSKKLASENS